MAVPSAIPASHSQLPIPHLAQRLRLVGELERHRRKFGLLVFGKHKRLASRDLKIDQQLRNVDRPEDVGRLS